MTGADPGADPRRAGIDAKLLAWMREPLALSLDAEGEERFDALARELFAFQRDHCAAYGRFCEARSATPESIGSWRDIPAVPTGAFKEIALRSFPAERCVKTFRTSGTSSAGTAARGALHLDTLSLYEASLLPTIQSLLLSDLATDARCRIRILAPSPAEAADSSLSHMFGCLVDRQGSPESGFDVVAGELHTDRAIAALERACRERVPVALCGTAFAFVHLLEHLLEASDAGIALPQGSRVMETGGFKGRVKEIPREELYARIERQLGVPTDRIVNQYGMTELGSQFYDSVIARPGEPRRKLGPPWARVRIVDPETGRDAPPGETGMIAVHDLANTGSVASILTEDLGRAILAPGAPTGFEVLGRHPEAEARGCSIASDLMLGG